MNSSAVSKYFNRHFTELLRVHPEDLQALLVGKDVRRLSFPSNRFVVKYNLIYHHAFTYSYSEAAIWESETSGREKLLDVLQISFYVPH